MKNKIYIIDGKTYLNHINDEVHLYGLLHQLAFLAGRIKDEEDMFHVLDAAKRYGEIAEEKFQGWGIPGRYLVFGDPKDLKDLMAKELAEATPVPVEEPKPKKYKDEYIIPGYGSVSYTHLDVYKRQACACGAASTSWKVTGRTTRRPKARASNN